MPKPLGPSPQAPSTTPSPTSPTPSTYSSTRDPEQRPEQNPSRTSTSTPISPTTAPPPPGLSVADLALLARANTLSALRAEPTQKPERKAALGPNINTVEQNMVGLMDDQRTDLQEREAADSERICEERLSDVKSRNEALEREVKVLQDARGDLEEKNGLWMERQQGLGDENRRLEREVLGLKGELRWLKEEVGRLRAENERLCADLEGAEMMLDHYGV